MAIEVKHGSDPAALAAVGFGGGQGATRTRLRAGMLAASDQRLRDEKSRGFQERQGLLERDWRARQAVEDRDWRTAQADTEYDRRTEGFELQSDMRRKDLDYELSARQRSEGFDYELSARQRREFNQLSEAYDTASSSGKYTPEELDKVRRQIIEKQAGIQAVPRMREKSPWPEGQGVGQSWANDAIGMIETRKADGTIAQKTNPLLNTQQDVQAAFKDALDSTRDELGQVDVEKAKTIAKAMLTLRKEMREEEQIGAEEAPAAGGEAEGAPTGEAGQLSALSTVDAKTQAELIRAIAKKHGKTPEIIREMLARKGVQILKEKREEIPSGLDKFGL